MGNGYDYGVRKKSTLHLVLHLVLRMCAGIQILSRCWPAYPCQSLEGIQLASSLQSLTFGYAFNRSPEGIQLPSSLQRLTCGRHFCQSLEGIHVASSLQSLTIGYAFNRSLESMQLPSCLQVLSFGYEFNQSSEGTQLSSCLQGLMFGFAFNRSLEGIQLHSRLHQTSTFADWRPFHPVLRQTTHQPESLNPSLGGTLLPSSLQGLTFGRHFSLSLQGMQLLRRRRMMPLKVIWPRNTTLPRSICLRMRVI